jgi:tellurite resistance protein
MLTFDPERSIARAQRVLPAGGWFELDALQRELILRAASAMAEADGPVSADEELALERLTEFLMLPRRPRKPGADLGALAEDLALQKRDRAFARHLFVSTYLLGMSDGVLMDSERAFLESCQRALGMDARACEELESELHGILYEEMLETCYGNGDVSARERKILSASAKLLRISDETASVIESAYKERVLRGGMGAY